MRTQTLVERLREHAVLRADHPALRFIEGEEVVEELTFAALDQRIRALAAHLQELAGAGERAVILLPNGPDYAVAFYACLYAGVIAVPAYPPESGKERYADRLEGILCDATPRFILTQARLRDGIAASLGQTVAHVLAVDTMAVDAAESWRETDLKGDAIAFLQYTSGSTSQPKGVCVTHRNLVANEIAIEAALGGTRDDVFVSWLPLYHDMGLILNALEPIYVGALCVLMAPNGFMQRPLNWLRAIHHYKAEVTSSPNFGFDLCVARYRTELMQDIDLSSWKVASVGAEPVRAETLQKFIDTFAAHGFRKEAMFPAYGMAEATLLITGGRRGAGHLTRDISAAALQAHRVAPPKDGADAQTVVGCGRALEGEQIAIVDPQTRARLPLDRVGEVWVDGPNVARIYWRNEAATHKDLHAQIEGEDSTTSWLRTGDLGFVDESGELFITGRIKDLIIIRGINHYPQDIEQTVQHLHPSLRQNGGAAFSVPDETGEETLVVVQEIERTERNRIDAEELTGLIREGIADQHEVFARHIALIRPGSLPKTTSGKIQRSLARKLWLEGRLNMLDRETG